MVVSTQYAVSQPTDNLICESDEFFDSFWNAYWDTKPNISAVSALNVLTNGKCNTIKQRRSFLFSKGMEMLILVDNFINGGADSGG